MDSTSSYMICNYETWISGEMECHWMSLFFFNFTFFFSALTGGSAWVLWCVLPEAVVLDTCGVVVVSPPTAELKTDVRRDPL